MPLFVVRDQASLIKVVEFPKAIAASRIIFGSRANYRGIFSIAIKIDFHFAFAPPCIINWIGNKPNISAPEYLPLP